MDAFYIPRPNQENDLTVAFELQNVVKSLAKVRNRWRVSQKRSNETGGRELPSREALSVIMKGLRGILFPMRLGPLDLRQESEDYYVGHVLNEVLLSLLVQVQLELKYKNKNSDAKDASSNEQQANQIVRDFSIDLASVREQLDSDVIAAYEGDPAAQSVDEVLLCYPGIQAMINHRIAHLLYKSGVPLIARIIAELAHSETGIDIHPGATIDSGFFIDHGTGVVIGETAVIGKRVRIYQAVTLGARSFPTDASGNPIKGRARHPVVEDDVVIYAGATVLGRVTIGHGASIGGNVWVTHNVEPNQHVTQADSRQDAEAPSNTRPYFFKNSF
ncbi:serine O-acetyltransferase [Jezberella montanilacus]|uniref:serine O-acetyltransferase n=1 Tax=Jezberella montanilacus TaxID=323426 RepID=A0A2T0XD38_9BURK|nr:serine O-acetyltransferase EpsC [Jezberella montanilacus]PRY96848.1 serine O-acetyltransferase [Jezberella montanilacus]